MQIDCCVNSSTAQERARGTKGYGLEWESMMAMTTSQGEVENDQSLTQTSASVHSRVSQLRMCMALWFLTPSYPPKTNNSPPMRVAVWFFIVGGGCLPFCWPRGEVQRSVCISVQNREEGVGYSSSCESARGRFGSYLDVW